MFGIDDDNEDNDESQEVSSVDASENATSVSSGDVSLSQFKHL